jgi:BlaI family transcriptional regulator, penicillinase repressor
MGEYSNLSEADSIIMEILWRDGECSSAAILKEIEDKLNWSRQTVRTYLVRLVEKGLVGTKEINKRTYHYYPVVSRAEYAAGKTSSILNKYYNSLPNMVAGIIQNEKISDADLEELEKLIRRVRNKEAE